MKSTHVMAAVAAGALAASAGLLVAGPLNPPAGPVVSSYKTLGEVEPRIAVNAANTPGDSTNVFKITQSGSYYLTASVFTGQKTGILIGASGVTLDLNGFEVIDAQPAGGPTRYGVVIPVGTTNVTVKNGSIRSINAQGVRDQGAASRFENLKLSSCGQDGLYSEHPAAISFCSAYGCGLNGFEAAGGTLLHCTAEQNGGKGFFIPTTGVATACIALNNTGSGFDVQGCVVTNCSSMGNSYGFFAAGSTVMDCSATSNNSGGIRAESGCLIKGNAVETPTSFANILVTGLDNRIEGNHTTGGQSCVQVSAVGHDNIVIGNSSFGAVGTPFNVALASNVMGPVVTAVGTISSTSPFANFAR